MHFIGIDLHKHIFMVCVLDDNENVVDEMIDVKTDETSVPHPGLTVEAYG